MAATRASGTNAVRYGTMRENVLNLTAVLPDGRIVKTARRAKKSAAGYDLTRLLVGSEGTLGIITELTLKVYGIPEAISSAVCAFPKPGRCGQYHHPDDPVGRAGGPGRIGLERNDGRVHFLFQTGRDMSLPITCFLNFMDPRAASRNRLKPSRRSQADFGGTDFKWATKPEDRNTLWTARHNAHMATRSLRPGCEVCSTDVCVPISRLTEIVSFAKKTMDEAGIVGTIVGHVGDGNFHVGYVRGSRAIPRKLKRAEAHNRRACRNGDFHGRHLHRRAWESVPANANSWSPSMARRSASCG